VGRDDEKGQWKNPIIKTRNVIWREVERGGLEVESGDKIKRFGRAHINLPPEVVSTLNLSPGGDMVAFVMTKDNKHVILTNFFETRLNDIKLENDPQFLLERLLANVLSLKSKEGEVLENWYDGKIEDVDYLRDHKQIREELDRISQETKKYLSGFLRGQQEITWVMKNRLRSLNEEYEKSFISYTQDVVSRINMIRKRKEMVAFAYKKRFFKEDDYLHEEQELKSQLESLLSTSHQAIKILTEETP
jgi:hypothetical protein